MLNLFNVIFSRLILSLFCLIVWAVELDRFITKEIPAVTDPLENIGFKWKDNIKMDLNEIESESVDWIYLA
jgi:hypothetical protein